MEGLGWLGPVNEIPYTNEVRFAFDVDNADGTETGTDGIEVIQEDPTSNTTDSSNLSDIYMNSGEKTLFGFSYKKIAIVAVIAIVAYLVLKK